MQSHPWGAQYIFQVLDFSTYLSKRSLEKPREPKTSWSSFQKLCIHIVAWQWRVYWDFSSSVPSLVLLSVLCYVNNLSSIQTKNFYPSNFYQVILILNIPVAILYIMSQSYHHQGSAQNYTCNHASTFQRADTQKSTGTFLEKEYSSIGKPDHWS